jgi:hypothetical protein
MNDDDDDDDDEESWIVCMIESRIERRIESSRSYREALYQDLQGNNPDVTEVAVDGGSWVRDGGLLVGALMNSEVVSSVIFNLCEMSEEFGPDLKPAKVQGRMAPLLRYLAGNEALQKVSLLCTSDETWNDVTISPCVDLMCEYIFAALARRATLTHFVFDGPCFPDSLCPFLSGPIRLQKLTLSESLDNFGTLEIARAVASQSDLACLRITNVLTAGLVAKCLRATCDHATLTELNICKDYTDSWMDADDATEIADCLRANCTLVRLELLHMRVERPMDVLLPALYDHPTLEEIVLCPDRNYVTSPPLTLSSLLRSTNSRIRHVILQGFEFDAESWTLLLDSIEARSTSTMLTVRIKFVISLIYLTPSPLCNAMVGRLGCRAAR